jgi:putative transposon-encoded protein
MVIFSVINTYIHCTHYSILSSVKKIMVRRMKAIIKQIESVVTPSGNSGHVVVPKDCIGKEVVVKIKQEEK